MNTWDETITTLKGVEPHIFQTRIWAEIKSQTGWKPTFLAWYRGNSCYHGTTFDPALGQPSAAALVLKREVKVAGFAARLGVYYVPKGPLLDWENQELRRQVLGDLASIAKRQGGIFIKVDPDIQVSTGYPATTAYQANPLWLDIQGELTKNGWHPSKEQIQYKNTVMVDLSLSEAELLAYMKQKTRYNIRLAERRGVSIRIGGYEDLPLLHRMYAETSIRDGFVIRDAGYYLKTWQLFMENGRAEPLIAEVAGEPVAAVIIIRFANQAWYLYGMSRETHRDKMPNYLLQWEAMRRAKAAGCHTYDLWGAPDELNDSDPLWGVYRFKEGLGGKVICTMGAWDLPLRPVFYRLYTDTMPRLLEGMRRRGKRKTLQEIQT